MASLFFGSTDYPFQWTNPAVKNGTGVLSIGKTSVRMYLSADYQGTLAADTFVRLDIGSSNIAFTGDIPPSFQLSGNAVSNRLSGVLTDQAGNVISDSQFSAVMIAGAAIPNNFSWAIYVCSKSMTVANPSLKFDGYSYITNPSPQSGIISSPPSSQQASYTYPGYGIDFGDTSLGFVMIPNTNSSQVANFSLITPAITPLTMPGSTLPNTFAFQVARPATLPYFIMPAAQTAQASKIQLTNEDGPVSVASATLSMPRAMFTDSSSVTMWVWTVSLTYFSAKDINSMSLAFNVPMQQAFYQSAAVPLPLG